MIPYYQQIIEPQLKAGKNVLIVTHGNSLRALMMYLEHIDLTTSLHRRYRLEIAGTELNVIKYESLT